MEKMTQASSSSTTNLMASSSPIKIGTGSGSFHGQHGQSAGAGAGATNHQHHHSHQGTVIGISASGSATGTDSPVQSQQSSSVPVAVGQNSQSQTALMNAGVSNQSMPSSVSAGAGASAGAGGGGGAAGFVNFGSSLTPPSSAGLRQTSGGITHWGSDNRDKYDGNQADKTPTDTSKLNRKESYKAQRKNYRREKKRVASELLNSLQDPAVIVLADWLKVRGTLKSWTKLWCVLKPGLLLIYKSPKTKSSHWVGTVLISSCQVIERPSKKDGFCFKLFHPLEQSIWAPRGPDKETIGAVVQPLPTSYLIFRAPSQAAGKCWMDALELSLRCTALLLRSNSNSGAVQDVGMADTVQISHETQWSEADYEKHFNEQDFDGDSQNEVANTTISGADTDTDSEPVEPEVDTEVQSAPVDLPETPYIPLAEGEFGQTGEQVEELADENKSLIWCLVKQVRPGMDLSKVVLPTFILEPRSFLDKLSDSYYHADLLSRAVLEDDPFTRMKTVVQWYLSGFYKKPKGLKKPYNPILGETFRCYWEHPDGSRTFYIAEQVSHHPPVSAFYVTNRQDGYCISCSIVAKSKFYGNSTSAVLDGVATLTLLPRGESYTLTTPYAHCKGILLGTLSMELGGKINIECENTGYKTELEFKLKPFLGGNDHINNVVGKIKLGKEVLATINGHWDSEMRIKEMRTNEETVLFSVNRETKSKRLMRYVVPLDAQLPNESERLWRLVSDAIKRDDQTSATQEKTALEEEQRRASKDRKAAMIEWVPQHFQQDMLTGEWIYKYADLRPWDPRNDLKQYEAEYKVLTKTRLEAPLVRTASVISGDILKVKRRNKSLIKLTSEVLPSDSSVSHDENVIKKNISAHSVKRILSAIEQVHKALDLHTEQLNTIQVKLERMQFAPIKSTTSFMSENSLYHWAQNSMQSGSILTPAVMYTIMGLFIVYFLKAILK